MQLFLKWSPLIARGSGSSDTPGAADGDDTSTRSTSGGHSAGRSSTSTWRQDLLLVLITLLIAVHVALLYSRYADSARVDESLIPDASSSLRQPSAAPPASTASPFSRDSWRGIQRNVSSVQDSTGILDRAQPEGTDQQSPSLEGAEESAKQLGQGGGGEEGEVSARNEGMGESQASAPAPTVEDAMAPCVAAVLLSAEAVFRRHLAKRNAKIKEGWHDNSTETKRSDADIEAELGSARLETETDGEDHVDVMTEEQLLTWMFVPPYPCVREERVGNWAEGGKWICREYTSAGKVERAPTVVSVGSRGDVSFERDINETFQVAAHTFDPFLGRAIDNIMKGISFLHFHKQGFMGTQELAEWRAVKGSDHPFMLNLKALLNTIGTDHVDIFKIDCEGCEFGFAQDVAAIPRSEQALGMILVEVHGTFNVSRIMTLLSSLHSAGYRLFHSERNAFCHPCYELSFIHESLLAPAPTSLEKALATGGAAAPYVLVYSQNAEEVSCREHLLRRAEEQHTAQMQRRNRSFGRTRGRPPKYMRWDKLIAVMLVSTYPCVLKERFGIWGKGGAWVCLIHKGLDRLAATAESDSHPTGPLVVTIGGNGSLAGCATWQFEQDLVDALQAEAHVLNPSLPPEEVPPPPIKLYNTEKQLTDVLKGDEVAVLRVDCDGCEYGLVDDMARLYDAGTVPFQQILIEIHGLMDAGHIMQLLNSLEALGYRMFSSEEVDGSRMTYELAFIHERSCR